MKLEDLDAYLKPDKNGCLVWQRYVSRDGYGRAWVDGRLHLVHRLVVQRDAEIPPGMRVDHTCFNRACANREHLRVVTNKQNAENLSGVHCDSSTGVRGVYWIANRNKWRAQAGHNYRVHYAGYFDSKEDAEQAAIALRNSLHTHNDLDKK